MYVLKSIVRLRKKQILLNLSIHGRFHIGPEALRPNLPWNHAYTVELFTSVSGSRF